MFFSLLSNAGGSGGYLADLAGVFSVAAIVTIIFQRIHLPVVLGYLLAGLIVGPETPWRFVAHPELAQPLSDIGVILLMFSLGLEFSVRHLFRIAPTGGLIALIECSLVAWLAYFTGRMLGLAPFEALFVGAFSAISSTTLIAKTFAENRIRGQLSDVVFGVLVAEDLIAILLLTLLTALSAGHAVSAGDLGATVAKLVGFLLIILGAGMFLVPRLVRFVASLGRSETVVMSCLGLAFLFAFLAQTAGYSLALGSFLAGALVAESGEARLVERLVRPLRDVFAAIFFVSVGMLIDLQVLADHTGMIALLVFLIVGGKIVGVTLGSFVAGHSLRISIQAGMSLAQIGEFSFIIAGLGVTSGTTRPFLFPVAIAVSAITALLTPILIRASGPFSAHIDRLLPPALQTYAALYGSWIRTLKHGWNTKAERDRLRRLAMMLLLDCLLVATLVILTSLYGPKLATTIGPKINLKPIHMQAVTTLLAIIIGIPLFLGAVRVARALGAQLTQEAFPRSKEGIDLADAPRKALFVTLELTIFFAAGAPLVALTQPFLPPGVPFAFVIIAGLGLLAIPFWRSTTNLQGHVRAGAQVLLETLVRQSHSEAAPSVQHETLRQLLPGMGEPTVHTIAKDEACRGHTLKDLDLRGLTGATVLAIERKPNEVIFPSATIVLHDGDVLVLAGSKEAVESARILLQRKDPVVAPISDGAPVG
jgi:CPA2 family monovalent cation:H+ antiporter-2